MGKQSAARILAVLLTAALIGGTYYFAVMRPTENAEPAGTTWTTVVPHNGPSSGVPTPSSTSSRTPQGGDPGSPEQQFFPPPDTLSAEPAGNWTSTIRKCVHPEIGEFYTNAASCEDADPHNRISIAEPLNTTPAENRYSGQNYTTPEQDAGNSRSD